MRRLIIILTALTVAAVQLHAGIFDWLLGDCDDPKVSNFFHYFSHSFEKLKLKKLITTCYKNCDADLFSKHTAEKGIYLGVSEAQQAIR